LHGHLLGWIMIMNGLVADRGPGQASEWHLVSVRFPAPGKPAG